MREVGVSTALAEGAGRFGVTEALGLVGLVDLAGGWSAMISSKSSYRLFVLSVNLSIASMGSLLSTGFFLPDTQTSFPLIRLAASALETEVFLFVRNRFARCSLMRSFTGTNQQ